MKVFKTLLVSFLAASNILTAQKKTPPKLDIPTDFKMISDEIMLRGKSYSDLRELTKSIGPRFSGTQGYTKAEDWAEAKLKEAGAVNIWRQPVKINYWERGHESLQINFGDGNWRAVKMHSLGSSEGTGGKDLTAEILFLKNLQELNALTVSDVKGKIVFFNVPMDQTVVNTPDAYMEAGKYRWATASAVAKKGGLAVISRSLTSALDDVVHTGSVSYDPGEKNKIPALCIGTRTADELEAAAKRGKVSVKLNTTSGTRGEKTVNNIIGEIPGNRDKAVILAAAHLDSWDITEGAHDNGAGVAHCLEVLRTFKNLGIKNNHTIRVVLYANEENGVSGGENYAAVTRKKEEKHIFAIESDAGGCSPRGISLDMIPQRRTQIFGWKNYFLPYGVYDFSQTYAGQDIAPLKKLDIPLAELVPDMQRYFDIHHTADDTFDKVNRRELLLGSVTMTQIIYLVDKNW